MKASTETTGRQNKGFVRLRKDIIYEPWYRNAVTNSLFIHLLLNADIDGTITTSENAILDKITIRRKQLISSLRELAGHGMITYSPLDRGFEIRICNHENYFDDPSEDGCPSITTI